MSYYQNNKVLLNIRLNENYEIERFPLLDREKVCQGFSTNCESYKMLKCYLE